MKSASINDQQKYNSVSLTSSENKFENHLIIILTVIQKYKKKLI